MAAVGVSISVTLFIIYIFLSRGIDKSKDDGYRRHSGFYCEGTKPSTMQNVSEDICFAFCIKQYCECFDYEVTDEKTGSSSCTIFITGDVFETPDRNITAFKHLYTIPSLFEASLEVNDDILSSTSDTFGMTGVNFDFWPSSKNKWQKSGALEIDLTNKRLITLTKALGGSLLRMGGSPADMLLYDTYPGACSIENLNKTQKHSSGYYCPIWDQVKGQCLTMNRWRELNVFALRTGLKIAFDLNACWGRDSAKGEMNFTMIEGLIRETSLGKKDWAQIFAFEFGNELYSNVAAERYASDLKYIRNLLKKYWKESTVPKLVGPDCGAGYLSNHYLDTMLAAADGDKTLHAVTVHLYGENGKCRRHLTAPGFVLSVTCMDSLMSDAMIAYKKTTAKHNVPLWIGEGALQASSGKSGLTNVFTSSFWYINTLASFAESNIGLFSRQTLIGGDYELIDKKTFNPNPDYWVLLLWRQLSGNSALKSDWLVCSNDCKKCLRSYSRSSLKRRKLTIIINFCLEGSFSVTITRKNNVELTANSKKKNDQNANYVNIYQLTGSPTSRVIKLNGEELMYDGGDRVPDLGPYINPATSPVSIPAGSITFMDY